MTELQDLVKRVIDGDRTAREAFYDRYHRLVWHIIRGAGLSREDADDLFSTFFLHLFKEDCQRLRQWRGETLEAFLSQMVRRLAIDFLRAKQTVEKRTTALHYSTDDNNTEEREKINSALHVPDPGAILLVKEIKETLHAGLAMLSERDRELLRRFHTEDETYDEIATAMGISLNNVGVSLKRARERLKKVLSQKYPDLFLP